MYKEEPNFNIWGEISVSESVLEAATGRAKIRNTRKTSLRAVGGVQFATIKIKCYCKKQIDLNFPWSTLL